MVIVDGEVVDVGTGPPPAADAAVDAGGRCVMPGFVDSHSHLVFAGDRVGGVRRPDGRASRTRPAASPPPSRRPAQASDDELRPAVTTLLAEARRSGTTTIEIKSGYGLTTRPRGAPAAVVAEDLTPETTFLGAHVVPDEYAGRADDYVDLVCGEMLDRCAPHARWIDAFCETGAFTPTSAGPCSTPGAGPGSGLRLHANQLGHGDGVRLAVELGCASVDHCTYLSDRRRRGARRQHDRGDVPAGHRLLDPPAVPRCRGGCIDAGVTVALAANCNPGSSYTTSMPFCIALAVRDLGMTPDEAIAGGDRRRAPPRCGATTSAGWRPGREPT